MPNIKFGAEISDGDSMEMNDFDVVRASHI
jgi:hypothetical protein